VKAKIMLGFLLVALGTAFGVAARSAGPIPSSKLGTNCPVRVAVLSGGDPTPICLPGKPCLSEK
jgi:hypothetical protein